MLDWLMQPICHIQNLLCAFINAFFTLLNYTVGFFTDAGDFFTGIFITIAILPAAILPQTPQEMRLGYIYSQIASENNLVLYFVSRLMGSFVAIGGMVLTYKLIKLIRG